MSKSNVRTWNNVAENAAKSTVSSAPMELCRRCKQAVAKSGFGICLACLEEKRLMQEVSVTVEEDHFVVSFRIGRRFEQWLRNVDRLLPRKYKANGFSELLKDSITIGIHRFFKNAGLEHLISELELVRGNVSGTPGNATGGAQEYPNGPLPPSDPALHADWVEYTKRRSARVMGTPTLLCKRCGVENRILANGRCRDCRIDLGIP